MAVDPSGKYSYNTANRSYDLPAPQGGGHSYSYLDDAGKNARQKAQGGAFLSNDAEHDIDSAINRRLSQKAYSPQGMLDTAAQMGPSAQSVQDSNKGLGMIDAPGAAAVGNRMKSLFDRDIGEITKQQNYESHVEGLRQKSQNLDVAQKYAQKRYATVLDTISRYKQAERIRRNARNAAIGGLFQGAARIGVAAYNAAQSGGGGDYGSNYGAGGDVGDFNTGGGGSSGGGGIDAGAAYA